MAIRCFKGYMGQGFADPARERFDVVALRSISQRLTRISQRPTSVQNGADSVSARERDFSCREQSETRLTSRRRVYKVN